MRSTQLTRWWETQQWSKLTSLKYAPHSWPGGEKPNNDPTIPHWQTDTAHWQTPHTDRYHILTDRCHILPDATRWQTPHTNRQMPHSARCYTLTDATHWHHTERQTPHTDRHHTLTDTTHCQTPHTDRQTPHTDRCHTLMYCSMPTLPISAPPHDTILIPRRGFHCFNWWAMLMDRATCRSITVLVSASWDTPGRDARGAPITM